MLKEFAFDLKVARRKSGLSQSDCAHLLDVDRTKIYRLERGDNPPTVREFCTLSLVHGKSFESLFGPMFQEVRDALIEQLASIPNQSGKRIGQFNRTNTLSRLAARLETFNIQDHGAA